MLLFRSPITSPEEQARFYQRDYRQGFTTNLPDGNTLDQYLRAAFRGTEKDYSTYISVLGALGVGRGLRLFDFGCSWGYGSWQFQREGFDVESFEVSARRAAFGRDKLGLKVHSALSGVSGLFDVFFSAHVLEHVPSVGKAIDFAFSILKPGGLFVAFTPNGSQAHRTRRSDAWHRLWGLAHPNFLDDIYYRNLFAGKTFLLASNPYDLRKITEWSAAPVSGASMGLAGDEILVAVRA